MHTDDGMELHNAAKYLRGQMQPVSDDASSDLRVWKSNFELYRRTRLKALDLWCGTISGQGNLTRTHTAGTTDGWPGDGERSVPCLLWCSSCWHCATASWLHYPEKRKIKVDFFGYDREDAVIVDPLDPRLRPAVLDPRGGRDHPNNQVLKGIFPQKGDHVRVHFIDAAEAPLFLEEGRYLAGVVVAPTAAHDSSLVDVVGLAGIELFLVPNTRMEFVTARDSARVTDVFKTARNQVLRQLDIATSQTIAIEVVSGVGEIADDEAPVSLWALGDKMVIRVWQKKGEFMLETSVPAVEALAAVGMKGSGLTVLLEDERKHLLEKVRGRLRVCDGVLTMGIRTDQRGQHPGTPTEQFGEQTDIGGAPIHRESHKLEGVAVETVVAQEGAGGLLVRSRTLLPVTERTDDILTQPEDWAPLGFPALHWLHDGRKADLAQKLTHCLCARDGSLVLQIGGRTLRSVGYFPMPSLSKYSSTSKVIPTGSDLATTKASPNQREDGDTPCPSGARSGLCSCLVILRAGIALPSLPLSDAETSEEMKLPPSSRRWLVMVKAVGGDLVLSLFRPSTGSGSKGPSVEGGKGAVRSDGASGTRGSGRPKHVRRLLSLRASWEDWVRLGYGPLQWMSHAQKMFLGTLSLSWVSIRATRHDHHAAGPHPEAFLHFRPIIARVTRVVCEPRQKAGATHTLEAERSGRGRVTVRDEGRAFRVEVEEEVEGRSQWRRFERTFGKEAWRETGLEELLWMNCSWRKYLAGRLAQQVAIATTDSEARDGQQQDTGSEQASLFILSDLPVLYWLGNVAIPRLGSREEGVFVVISDIGRQLLIDVNDFEGGPVLASSKVSLEAWTAATGVPALRPPADKNTFRERLEDELAGMLGVGFRSRTKLLVQKRAAREMQPTGSGPWRGTLLHLSDIEMGLGKLEEHDGGNVPDGPGAAMRPRPSLPPVSSPDVTISQKRALKLGMLARMIDDYHTKHGRRDDGKGGLIEGGRNSVNSTARPRPREPPTAVRRGDVEIGDIGDNATDIALPAIAPKSSGNSVNGQPAYSSVHPTIAAVGGGELIPAHTLTSHVCACCGGEGGKGHGRRCAHRHRRCGLCRVTEVRRVLLGAEHGRRRVQDAEQRGIPVLKTPSSDTLNDKGLLLIAGSHEESGEEEDDYDWVTDSDEENLEFECDVCGTVISEEADRFHCETCGDYDLCQACFLSGKVAGGHAKHQEEAVADSRHTADHAITRVMAKPAVVPSQSS